MSDEQRRFLESLFTEADLIGFRLIESWADGGGRQSGIVDHRFLMRAEVEAELPRFGELNKEPIWANIYFGVCPRSRPSGTKNDVRIIRVLWADIDDCPPREAIERCRKAKLPQANIVVNSGHGTHLYWKMETPSVIHSEEDGRRIESVVREVGRRIGGDHTHDRGRLLRLPGFANVKNARNGAEPTPCTIVRFDPEPAIASVADMIQMLPEDARRRIDGVREVTAATRTEGNGDVPEDIAAWARRRLAEDVEDRSRRDFEVVCRLVERGLGREPVRSLVSSFSKFAARGDGYFEMTYDKAVAHVKEENVQRARPAIHSNQASRLDAISLAKAFVAERHAHTDGSTLRMWSDDYWAWNGSRYLSVPDVDIKTAVANWLVNQRTGVTRKLVAEVLEFVGFVCHVPYTIAMPAFLDHAKDVSAENIVAFKNTLVELTPDGDIKSQRQHTPNFFSSIVLPYDFDESSVCPAWHAFLEQVLPDPQSRQLLQMWFGLLLTPDTSYQKLLLLVGPKRAGKGTVCRIVEEVFGQHACTSPSLSSLGSEFGLAPLLSKTIAILPDAHLGRRADVMRILEVLKSIVGEDSQNVNRKHRAVLTGVRLNTRFILTVNELPHFRDASGALADRLLILQFPNSFSGREDRSLSDTLARESAGIVNWAIDGLRQLRTAGEFTVPDASKDILENFTSLASPIAGFVEECCILDGESWTCCSAIYDAWCGWAKANGQREKNKAQFGEQLRVATQGGVERKRGTIQQSRTYMYTGVYLNQIGEDFRLRRREHHG